VLGRVLSTVPAPRLAPAQAQQARIAAGM
jgi:hypothetical protein